MKYFTSDLHFHHPFVAALRGFAKEGFISDGTIKAQAESAGVPLDEAVDWRAHDDLVCRNIAETIGEDDDLYVLGDISSGSKGSFSSAIETLKGLGIKRSHMHLVLGNHEDLSMSKKQITALAEVFSDISLRSVVTINGRNIAMSHFQFSTHFFEPPVPGLPSNASAKRYLPYTVADDGDTLLLHGHTHAKSMFEFGVPREMNIGLDAWDMKPVSEEQVALAFGLVDDDGRDDGQKVVSEDGFADIVKGFLMLAYDRKSRTVRTKRREYERKLREIEDGGDSANGLSQAVSDLNSQYSKVVLRYAPDDKESWADEICSRLMKRCRGQVGDNPEFKDIRCTDSVMTATVTGKVGTKSVRVSVAGATSKVSTHAVITFGEPSK